MLLSTLSRVLLIRSFLSVTDIGKIARKKSLLLKTTDDEGEQASKNKAHNQLRALMLRMTQGDTKLNSRTILYQE